MAGVRGGLGKLLSLSNDLLPLSLHQLQLEIIIQFVFILGK